MTRLLAVLIASCLLVSILSSPACASINVQRGGSENPMQEVAKSVFYGALAGVVVGTAIAVADKGGNDGDIIRWSFVGGTFMGLGFGIWHVATRPSAEALLEFRDGGLHAGTFAPIIEPGMGARVTLVSARF